MTPSEAEAIVRKVWEQLGISTPDEDENMSEYRFHLSIFMPKTCHTKRIFEVIGESREACVNAALAFTREHMRKIAEKVEEIQAVTHVIEEMCDCPGADLKGTIAHLAMKRILVGLESELAVLRRGVREEYQDGRLEGL